MEYLGRFAMVNPNEYYPIGDYFWTENPYLATLKITRTYNSWIKSYDPIKVHQQIKENDVAPIVILTLYA